MLLRRSVALLPRLQAVGPCSKVAPCRAIRTSASIEGGGGHYSEITDYNIHLWDRPNGFYNGFPEQESVWDQKTHRPGHDYYTWALGGLALAFVYYGIGDYGKEADPNYEEALAIASLRVQEGVLVDLFPDQKASRQYVGYRMYFPDHDPWTYDPTVPRPEYEGDENAFPDTQPDLVQMCRDAGLEVDALNK